MTGGSGPVSAAGVGGAVAGEGGFVPVGEAGFLPAGDVAGGPDNGRGAAGSCVAGGDEQATKLPTIAANSPAEHTLGKYRNGILSMALILLEALLALILIVAIVWWTMFSGRSKGELPSEDNKESDDKRP